ncbi:MAG: dihydrodipicolinate synthase family protein [Treponema sp.]|jgi:4-hydroxy-tetrahydrodipicolinate synthase|nr:dihydrodipicolinate synthase family protein [Treponema sp.]
MAKKYHGVIPPIITPVDENENVDEKGFRALLRYCADRGIHGMFVGGTNGETMALTREQRDRAIKITLDEIGKDIPVMAGVMDSSTRRVIENIKRLEQMGGKCAVVTPIFYARHNSQEETVRHFEAIVKETSIDLAVYNIPPFTGQKLTAATIIAIAQLDHVVVIKDSAGDFTEFHKIIREYERNLEISVLQGITLQGTGSFLVGADGYVPSIAPLFPELFVAHYEAGVNFYKTNDREVFKKLMILDALVAETAEVLGMSKNAFAANKFAISILGFTDKRVIRPVDTINTGEEKKIREKVAAINEKIRAAGLIP